VASLLVATPAVGAAAAALALPPLAFALGGPAMPLLAAAVGLGAVHAVHRAPVVLAELRRTRALGATTGLLGRAVLRMRIEPSPERAARFAAATGAGPLAESLGEHVRRAAGTPQSGFGGFAAEWREWFPALERSTALVEASADAPPGERGRTLDRATSAALSGTRERMAAFADEIRGPATAVYAFGVFLPLALVGALPTASAAGVHVPLSAVVLLYDVALPAALIAATGWLLLRRPVAFPPPRIGRDHPDVPDRTLPSLAAGVAAACTGWAAAGALVGDWAAGVAFVGFGAGAVLVVRYRPVMAVRERVREVETSLDDALYLVGRRVTEGEAVESALAAAAEEVTGATGDVLGEAVGVQRRLRVGVRESFLGEHGALSTVPSVRARGAASLLALAASEGRPAGRAVVSMADHLGELTSLEREARRELAQVAETLRNTAGLFAPLVAGATVALAATLSKSGATGGATAGTTAGSSLGAGSALAGGGGAALTAGGPSVGALGLAVGAYVLLLAVVLTALSAGLSRGLDRALVGYRVGVALLAATATYLAAFVGAGLFF
ncbi:MAG: type II secretion system protein, partial [Salinigranum sp.]